MPVFRGPDQLNLFDTVHYETVYQGHVIPGTSRVVLEVLNRSALFFTAALPKTIYPPPFNRYGGTTNAFGNHVERRAHHRRLG